MVEVFLCVNCKENGIDVYGGVEVGEQYLCDECMERWNNLPSEVQEALEEWLNHTPTDDFEHARLAQLYEDGDIKLYYCGECGEKVCCGLLDNWAEFQGVHETDPGCGELCADCFLLFERLKRLAY